MYTTIKLKSWVRLEKRDGEILDFVACKFISLVIIFDEDCASMIWILNVYNDVIERIQDYDWKYEMMWKKLKKRTQIKKGWKLQRNNWGVTLIGYIHHKEGEFEISKFQVLILLKDFWW